MFGDRDVRAEAVTKECGCKRHGGGDQRRAFRLGPAVFPPHGGINAGEPVAEEGDLYGTSVQLAARVCGHAEAWQIVASNVVRELTAGKKYLFAQLGDVERRGFEDAVRLYEVRWRD